MMKNLSLAELSKAKSWIIEQHGSGRGGHLKNFDPDSIYYRTLKKTSKNKILVALTIRMGLKVAKKMEIVPGDRINIFYHPDDLMSCMLVKSSGNRGYLAKFEANSTTILRIVFIWKRPIIIGDIPTTEAKYIHIPENNGILFRIEQ